MSDSYSGASQLADQPSALTAQPAALAAPSVIAPTTLANPDMDRIDRNFRRVTALEQATRLPALPDLVKMDLISAPGADEDSLTELLLGLDDAYSRRVSTTPQGGDPAASSYAAPGQADRSDESGVDQTRIIIAALAGQPQPRRVSVDATKQFKLRAIQDGVLDEDPHHVDNSWSPEFNRMRNDMMFDDLNDQMRGNHPGATSFERALGVIGEFTSPAGLLHMATELDLFWDFGAIGREMSTWGDKWRAVGEEGLNPLQRAGKVIDALTGPIDDIVFPVINDVLLVTGLGAIANSARVGWQGAELLRTGGMFSRLFEGSGTVGRFYDFIGSGAGRNLIEMRNPSLVSNLLGRGGRPLQAAGDALAAWRNLTPVVASKQVLQTGMRLGFAAAVENRVPGYNSDGLSISDVPGGAAVGNSLQNLEMGMARGAMGALGENTAGIVTAGVVTTGLELMFAPYNMFSPGTFFRHGNEGLGLISQTGRAGVGALGTTGGRAVVGAGAGALAGAAAGDSTEATLGGAAAGAAIGAGLPLAGRLLEAQRFRHGLIGGAAVTGGGLLLGEDPRDALITGALAGVGIAYLPSNVRSAVMNQAGVHAVDKMLEGAGQQMIRSSKLMIGRDQHAVIGWYNAVRNSLLKSPDDLAAWDQSVRNVGVQQAWADLKYGGDVEMASAEMTWAYGSFAIHFIASKQADAVGGGFENFNMARNKLIGQLVPIDIDKMRPVADIVDDVAARMAWQEHGGIGGDMEKVRFRQEQIRQDLSMDPEQALKLAEAHNQQSGATIAQLWDPRNFPNAEYVPRRQRAFPEYEQVSWKDRGEAFTEHVSKHYLDQIGGYGKWTPATEQIRQGRAAGLFDDASVMPMTDRFGRQVDPYTRKPPRDPQTVAVNEAIDDLLVGGTVDPARLPTVSPLAGATEAGRVTPGRADQLWKHDLETWADKIDDVVAAAKYLHEAQAKNWSSALDLSRLDDQFAAARLGGDTVTDRQLVEMAQQAAKAGVSRKSVKRLLSFVRRHNVPSASLDTTIRKMVDDLVNDAMWETHGFGRIVTDTNGRTLEGVDALGRRLKQLREKAGQTASKLDLDEMIARAEARGGPRIEMPTTDTLEQLLEDEFAGWTRAVAARLDEPTTREMEATLAAYTDPGERIKILGSYARQADAMPSVPKPGDVINEAEMAGDPWAISGGLAEMSLANDMLRHARGEAVPNWDLAAIEGVTRKAFQPGPLRDEMMFQAAARQGANVTPSAEAEALRQLRDGLAEHGYVAVHGTQFLMPEDLTFNTPTFTDVTRRHMNAVTHGNWFGRRPPIEARLLDDRRRRQALAAEFSKVGTDLSPEDETFTNILARLESALRAEQDDVARGLNRAHLQGGVVARTTERIKSSFTPVRLDDLGGFRRGTPARVKEALETMNLPPEQEQAVVRAINNFRNTDFQDMGLFAIEQYLRTKSVPAGFLKMLGGTKYGSRVIGRAGRQAATGGLVGGALGAATAGGDASFEDRLKAALTTGAVGAAAGGALALGVGKWDNATDIIQRAEDWRYGYLVDGYARLRDSMRFTLSPFFDLSRYTEGMMLAQTAAPLRDAKGARLVQPLNASPWALRRRIAKQLTKDAEEAGETLSSAAAKQAASNKYDRWMGEFKSSTKASGDFDVDAIDSAGQWFRQVGVLGFSPTDWMATAYANLRGTGMSAETAYHAAREMYQYGTRGRSAAEMSVNFIFFPFSFQKKALTHIGKWLNDDLGRSIILHDALKTYEVLDQKYNLNEMWHDHLPFLTQLGRLNLFAYGISPGQLGGINSQLFQTAGAAIHAFLPVGVNINDSSFASELIGTKKQHDAHRLGGLAAQMLPIWNDINWMIHDTSEVIVPELRAGAQRIAGVETPMAMESYRAQVQDGWDEFNAYRTDFEAMLASEGYSVSDVLNGNKDWLLPLKDQYERKVNELATRYPAWWASRIDAPGNAIAIGMEKDQRIDNVRFALQDGRPTSVDDLMVAQMQEYIDSVRHQVELGTGEGDLEAMPPQAWDAIRQMAANFVGTNPHFLRLWDRFWGRSFGPLTTPMELNG